MSQWYITFDTSAAMRHAARKLSERGVVELEAISPYAVDPEDDPYAAPRGARLIPAACLFGALSGITIALLMTWYSAVVDYPLNVGGRPLNSWPSFIPITYVLMILGAGLSTVIALFWQLRLPWLAHPVFHAGAYNLSRDVFGLVVKAENTEEWRATFASLGARDIEVIP